MPSPPSLSISGLAADTAGSSQGTPGCSHFRGDSLGPPRAARGGRGFPHPPADGVIHQARPPRCARGGWELPAPSLLCSCRGCAGAAAAAEGPGPALLLLCSISCHEQGMPALSPTTGAFLAAPCSRALIWLHACSLLQPQQLLPPPSSPLPPPPPPSFIPSLGAGSCCVRSEGAARAGGLGASQSLGWCKWGLAETEWQTHPLCPVWGTLPGGCHPMATPWHRGDKGSIRARSHPVLGLPKVPRSGV